MRSTLRGPASFIALFLWVGVAGCSGSESSQTSESDLNGEQSTFVADQSSSLTVEQRNQQLATALFEAPTLYRRVVRIDRDDRGWTIAHRPDEGPSETSTVGPRTSEKSMFVPDSATSVTTPQKNQQLSDVLADPPTIHRTIVRIVRRDTADAHGWWFIY